MDRWTDESASEMRRSSSELVIGDMVEPVGLRVVAVGFEIYAVGFLFVGHGISTTSQKVWMEYIYEDEYVPAQAYKAFPGGHLNPLHHPSLGP